MCCFFFNDTATTEIYTLSLHDALPISRTGDAEEPNGEAGHRRDDEGSRDDGQHDERARGQEGAHVRDLERFEDRKSTRLNSSHANISYAVFCLKKKNQILYLYIILILL